MMTCVNLLLSGIVLGGIYAVIALGLTLIYGVAKVFNYAQGSFFTLGGYIAYLLFTNCPQVNYVMVAVVTVGTMTLLGALFERVFVCPVRRLPDWDFTVIIVTLGAALLLDSICLVGFGPLSKTIPFSLSGSFTIGVLTIAKHDLVVLSVAVAAVVLLGVFLSKTRAGMAMRAVAQDEVGAKIVGVPIDRVYTLSFAAAGGLAGISAVLLTPRTLIYPLVGWPVFMKSMVVIVLGGLGSITGTLGAAVILGLVEVSVTYLIGGIWAMPIFLAILVLILVFRPKGLAGTWA